MFAICWIDGFLGTAPGLMAGGFLFQFPLRLFSINFDGIHIFNKRYALNADRICRGKTRESPIPMPKKSITKKMKLMRKGINY
jgi:hypothetical protein